MLILAALVAFATALFVLAPLLGWGGGSSAFEAAPGSGPAGDLLQRRQELLDAIKDLDMEHEVGKLTPEDHREIRETLTRQAVEVYRQMDRDARS
ncbi:MAG TPA: hypothetical protein VJV23_13935 [Candidatus Polarisedimenticolia bacterium]|nr:hypothetical protein [Candidatus Polarisedimenticolia bacterium]